jgi:hypothetical protein
MRPGIKSFTAEADDASFMKLGPIFLTGVASRLSPDDSAGKLECVIVCLEKDSIMIIPAGDGHLAVSVEESDALAVFKEVLPKIRKLTSSTSK